MTYLFIFGDSVAYGVGAEQAGWGDLLKQALHAKMYSPNGMGETYEVYNFAQPGIGFDFIRATYPEQLKHYRRAGKVIALVCAGGNNSRAKGSAANYISSIEDYEELASELIEALQKNVDELILLPSLIAVDESKTYPKLNPHTGGQSFFTNERIQLFNQALEQLCRKKNVTFVDTRMDATRWAEKYLYADGLHPNQHGHQFIFEKVWPVIKPLL